MHLFLCLVMLGLSVYGGQSPISPAKLQLTRIALSLVYSFFVLINGSMSLWLVMFPSFVLLKLLAVWGDAHRGWECDAHRVMLTGATKKTKNLSLISMYVKQEVFLHGIALLKIWIDTTLVLVPSRIPIRTLLWARITSWPFSWAF